MTMYFYGEGKQTFSELYFIRLSCKKEQCTGRIASSPSWYVQSAPLHLKTVLVAAVGVIKPTVSLWISKAWPRSPSEWPWDSGCDQAYVRSVKVKKCALQATSPNLRITWSPQGAGKPARWWNKWLWLETKWCIAGNGVMPFLDTQANSAVYTELRKISLYLL